MSPKIKLQKCRMLFVMLSFMIAFIPTVFNQTVVEGKKVVQKEEVYNKSQIPSLNDFSASILDEYHLKGDRYADKTITYDDSSLTPKQQQMTAEAIKQINDLNLVTLVKTDSQANITIKTEDTQKRIFGREINNTRDTYKDLALVVDSSVFICTNRIKKYSRPDLLFNQVVLHEVGHALGLGHNDAEEQIMAPVSNIDQQASKDGLHCVLDKDYINSLAVLYKN